MLTKECYLGGLFQHTGFHMLNFLRLFRLEQKQMLGQLFPKLDT